MKNLGRTRRWANRPGAIDRTAGALRQRALMRWTHRRDLAEGVVRDVWWAAGHGIAVKLRGEWYAGNGHRGLVREILGADDLVDPVVGPYRSARQAMLDYDQELDRQRGSGEAGDG